MADPYRKLQKQIASLGPGTEFLESLYNDMISSGELDPNTTYEEFVAMDPLNTFDIDREQRAGGGMMDINTMTAPLGYALGGPAGMVGRPTSDPELYEGYDPILGDWMKDRKMRQAQPPAGAVDMTGQYVAPPERPRWEKLRKLGKKAVKGIGEGLGELFGGRGAEGAEITEPLGDPQYVQSMIDSLNGAINSERMEGALTGNIDYKKIKVLEIKLGMYERLQASQGQ